jgi:hypothetical protein
LLLLSLKHGPGFDAPPLALTTFAVTDTAGNPLGNVDINVSRNIKLVAKDQFGNTLTSFTSSATISSNGTISVGGGATANFTAGVLASHAMTFSAAGSNIYVRATNGGVSSDSALFGVIDTGMVFGVEAGYTAVNINNGGGSPTIHQFASGEAGWTTTGNYAFITDLDSPFSPQTALEAIYPAGFVPGSGPMNHYRESSWINSGLKKVIVDLMVKVSANWYGHDASGVNKILHVWLPKTNTPACSAHNGGVLMFNCSGNGVIRARYTTQNGISANFNWNLTDVLVTRNQYVWIRLQLTQNTDTDPNGHVDMWVDEIKTMHHENVYHTGCPTKDFLYWTFNPTYGGAGGSNVPAEQEMTCCRSIVLVEN